MTIKNASRIINAASIGMLVFTAAALVNVSQKTIEADRSADNRFYSMLLVDELRESSEELTRQVRNYAATGGAAAEAAYNKVLAVRAGEEPRPANARVAAGERRALLDLLKEYGITEEEYRLVERANMLSNELVALEIEAMNAVKGVFKDSAGAYTVRGEPDRDEAVRIVFGTRYNDEVAEIMAPMDTFEEKVYARTKTDSERSERGLRIAEIISFGALGLVLCSALLNLIFSSLYIVRPLQVVTHTIQAMIADGKTHVGKRISVRGNNEISELAHFINQTFENISDLIRLIKTKSSDLLEIGTDLRANMHETANSVNDISAHIQRIKECVIRQNTSAGETHAAMEQVVGSIHTLNSLVENQGEHITQASSAIEEMVANTNSVTHTLVKNADNVKILREASEIGRHGLREVYTDIQEISHESEGLMEINAVMQDIAGQTNLLSMNAAIEAAHAGDAGKGFAVVADEIRKLAEHSGSQSKTIASVLQKIKAAIDTITGSTSNVLNKFEAIEAGVKIVSEQEEHILRAMEEQGIGSGHILEGVSGVNGITREVRAGAQVMLAGSGGVIEESGKLGKAAQEMLSGITEMAAGADRINEAARRVAALSGKNREGIDALMQEVARFTVD
jgi:methyl-accepting chemotaxis protein